MDLRKLLTILFLVSAGGILTVKAQEEPPTGFTVDEIIAKVDNYIVLKSELDRHVS